MILLEWGEKLSLTSKRKFLIFCFLSFFSFSIAKIVHSESFLEGALRHSKKSLDFQRIYIKRALRDVRRNYLSWIQIASESQIKEHLAVSHFGSRLYDSLQQYIRVSSQLPTSTWVRDSFYSIVFLELFKIETFIDSYYSIQEYNPNTLALSSEYIKMYQKAVANRASGEISSDEFKEIEKVIGRKLKNANLSEKTKEVVRVFLFLQFQSLGVG